MRPVVVILTSALMLGLAQNRARGQEASNLSQLVQNPIAKVVSVPFQSNLSFGVGPKGDEQEVLYIQPVIPFTLSDDWNLITRTIVPLVYEPELAPEVGDTGGLGDVSLALYLSPAQVSHSLIWGIGPAFTFPSATSRVLGQGKFSTGVSAVALTIQGPWLVGALATEVTSVSGDTDRKDVSQLLVQPFINYNFSRGWYLTSSPIITANWKAAGSQQWTVPLGGGAGRTFRVGKQAMALYIQAFDNVVRPHDAGNWILRLQYQLLFPK
jgi:hypothetical protein